MQVLVIKSSSLGDLVDTLPALSDAMHKVPNLSVDWICEPDFRDIPLWHPVVKNVIPVPLRQWRGKTFQLIFRSNIFRDLKRKLTNFSPNGYDAVIDAQGLIKSAWFLSQAAKGPLHGFAWNSAREPLASIAYDLSYDIPLDLHAVERVRRLFSKALNYDISRVSPLPNVRFSNTKKRKNRLICSIHASRMDKCWSYDKWETFLVGQSHLFDECVITACSLEEKKISFNIAKNVVNARVLSDVSLDNVAAEIAESRICISVDTGLSHIADFVGCPLITLFGVTDPKKVGPLSPNSIIVESDDNTMSGISIESVENAMKHFGIIDHDLH